MLKYVRNLKSDPPLFQLTNIHFDSTWFMASSCRKSCFYSLIIKVCFFITIYKPRNNENVFVRESGEPYLPVLGQNVMSPVV